MTEFGKQIKIALVTQGKTQKWLIEEVHRRTGLYFDRSYIRRITHGQSNNPKIVNAIKEALGI